MKVTVSSPDLRPSLIPVLQGFARAAALERIITTLAFRSDGMLMRLAGRRSVRLKGLLRRREIPPGLEQFVASIPLGELLFQTSGRLGFGDRLQHRIWMWSEPYFDRRVAQRVAGRAAVLYGHEHAALDSFEAVKRTGGVCILRQVNAHYRFLDKVVDEEHERFSGPETPARRALWEARSRVNVRKQQEYEAADLIVANSAFVRRTFIDAGTLPDKVVVVPTGCPTPLAVRPPRDAKPTVVLYAGQLSFRKGTPYLLDAWRRLHVSPERAVLVLAGRTMLPETFLTSRPIGVRVLGTVPAATLESLYRSASVLVLPTLCEGLAHVVPEALAHGLPVITTSNSGAESLIVHGENGWIVPLRHPAALADRIRWCLEHPTELAVASERALEMARSWPVSLAAAIHVETVLDFARRNVAVPT